MRKGLSEESLKATFKELGTEADDILKGKKTGYYMDTPENRGKGRVGQKYKKEKVDAAFDKQQKKFTEERSAAAKEGTLRSEWSSEADVVGGSIEKLSLSSVRKELGGGMVINATMDDDTEFHFPVTNEELSKVKNSPVQKEGVEKTMSLRQLAAKKIIGDEIPEKKPRKKKQKSSEDARKDILRSRQSDMVKDPYFAAQDISIRDDRWEGIPKSSNIKEAKVAVGDEKGLFNLKVKMKGRNGEEHIFPLTDNDLVSLKHSPMESPDVKSDMTIHDLAQKKLNEGFEGYASVWDSMTNTEKYDFVQDEGLEGIFEEGQLWDQQSYRHLGFRDGIDNSFFDALENRARNKK